MYITDLVNMSRAMLASSLKPNALHTEVARSPPCTGSSSPGVDLDKQISHAGGTAGTSPVEYRSLRKRGSADTGSSSRSEVLGSAKIHVDLIPNWEEDERQQQQQRSQSLAEESQSDGVGADDTQLRSICIAVDAAPSDVTPSRSTATSSSSLHRLPYSVGVWGCGAPGLSASGSHRLSSPTAPVRRGSMLRTGFGVPSPVHKSGGRRSSKMFTAESVMGEPAPVIRTEDSADLCSVDDIEYDGAHTLDRRIASLVGSSSSSNCGFGTGGGGGGGGVVHGSLLGKGDEYRKSSTDIPYCSSLSQAAQLSSESTSRLNLCEVPNILGTSSSHHSLEHISEVDPDHEDSLSPRRETIGGMASPLAVDQPAAWTRHHSMVAAGLDKTENVHADDVSMSQRHLPVVCRCDMPDGRCCCSIDPDPNLEEDGAPGSAAAVRRQEKLPGSHVHRASMTGGTGGSSSFMALPVCFDERDEGEHREQMEQRHSDDGYSSQECLGGGVHTGQGGGSASAKSLPLGGSRGTHSHSPARGADNSDGVGTLSRESGVERINEVGPMTVDLRSIGHSIGLVDDDDEEEGYEGDRGGGGDETGRSSVMDRKVGEGVNDSVDVSLSRGVYRGAVESSQVSSGVDVDATPPVVDDMRGAPCPAPQTLDAGLSMLGFRGGTARGDAAHITLGGPGASLAGTTAGVDAAQQPAASSSGCCSA